ncbi:hypothetical protein BDQ12DRAFT_740055 [Crucibulum laeve]|uniref:Uncharacterized protein n=1 Tax=Crucibulum laeve TaxID=68775 RepID=A0A5C3LFG3_9AGAR|nr:hypothetical protein BDQ12DRAFT_740055 [Crucibulum laeve]
MSEKLSHASGELIIDEWSGGLNPDSLKRSDSEESDDSIEHVVNVKNCLLCYRPRMSSKAEVDIGTHLAVCMSQDWSKVEHIVVGNFVAAIQAQRRWRTKIRSPVAGEYYTVNGERTQDHAQSPVRVCRGCLRQGYDGGSIETTAQGGEHVNWGQEFGYFAFGGSTIVLLFEKAFSSGVKPADQ